jgi:quercetin dioxygenase-like cupin family protein
MTDMDRRSTFAFGLVTASLLALPKSAVAETYGSDEGKELAPGVRQVNLGKRDTMIPSYKTVSMRDFVYQPGASTTSPTMGNDMVCHCLEGEFMITQGEGMEFKAKKGDVWSCAKGMPENGKNTGNTVAIMRVIDLLPA